jgi:hypothetical protein
METVVGILPKYQQALINGVIAEGSAYLNEDQKLAYHRAQFEKKVGIMLADNDDYYGLTQSKVDRPALRGKGA